MVVDEAMLRPDTPAPVIRFEVETTPRRTVLLTVDVALKVGLMALIVVPAGSPVPLTA